MKIPKFFATPKFINRKKKKKYEFLPENEI